MKKMCNFIGTILFIMTCILTCASHLANKFFRQDIGPIVVESMNLEEHMNMIFHGIEGFVPMSDREIYVTLKEDIIKNVQENVLLGETSKHMLDDIVGNSDKNQDINEVLKTFIHSYENQLAQVFEGFATKEEILRFIDEGLKYVPIQQVYNISVQFFQESIPLNYKRGLKILTIISQEIFLIGSIATGILVCVLFIVFHNHHWKWTLYIGLGTLCSSVLLFIAGQVVPRIYQDTLMQLHHALLQVSNTDFTMITTYAICLAVIGGICLGSYVIFSSKEKNTL